MKLVTRLQSKGFLLIGVLLASGWATAAPAPEPVQRQRPEVHLSMKPGAAGVGEEFQLPIYLEISPSVALGRLVFEMAFPKAVLSFVEIEKGFLLGSGPFQVAAGNPRSAGEAEIIRVEIASQSQGGDRQAVPGGLLGYLGFRVVEGAEPGDVFVENRIVLAETVEGTPVSEEQVLADNERVSVVSEDMIMIACFFYMH